MREFEDLVPGARGKGGVDPYREGVEISPDARPIGRSGSSRPHGDSGIFATSTGQRAGMKARPLVNASSIRSVASAALAGNTHAMAREQSSTNVFNVGGRRRSLPGSRAHRDGASSGMP